MEMSSPHHSPPDGERRTVTSEGADIATTLATLATAASALAHSIQAQGAASREFERKFLLCDSRWPSSRSRRAMSIRDQAKICFQKGKFSAAADACKCCMRVCMCPACVFGFPVGNPEVRASCSDVGRRPASPVDMKLPDNRPVFVRSSRGRRHCYLSRHPGDVAAGCYG